MNININTLIYTELLFFFIVSQIFSVSVVFVSLYYKNLSMWGSYKLAIPFSWVSWIFLTKAVEISTKYNLLDPNQLVFLLIITQFILIIIFNFLILKKSVTKSEIAAFFILIIAYAISNYNIFSNFFNLKIDNKDNEKKDEEISEIENV